jgi:hypothetical protein
MSSSHAARIRSTPATENRVERCLALRTATAESDASFGTPAQLTNGDEHRYRDKCGTYTKCVRQVGIGRVDLEAYSTFRAALDSGEPADFDAIILGGPRTLNGPQGGLAFDLQCLDVAQFVSPPAPALASELYATELVELYWASLLRDVAFTDFAANPIAISAAEELSDMRDYAGPRSDGKVTTGTLFRGGYPGEIAGPYLSQFLLQDTTLGVLPITQRYVSNKAGVDYMLDPITFQQVQNGIATGLSLQPLTEPLYLHDGRGLAAYTHADVLYQAYFTAFLVLNSMNAPLNPGNPYNGDKTQNGFTTFGQPDVAATLAAVASEALKAVWYQKWFVHLRHRPESGGAIVYLDRNGAGDSLDGRVSPTALHSRAVEASFKANNSYFLSQAFPEGSPSHPAYPTGHGAVAGACITVLKFFFDGAFAIPKPVAPLNSGVSTAPYSGDDAGALTVNGELNKLAHNISFGHGIHAGIHWRSDTDSSIELGEAVALSVLQDRAKTYNEKFKVELQKVDGTMATVSNL